MKKGNLSVLKLFKKKSYLLLIILLLLLFQSGLYANGIVLSLKTNGYWDLFTCDTNGNNLTSLFFTNINCFAPRWSNNDNKIAYVIGNVTGHSLQVIEVLGTI